MFRTIPVAFSAFIVQVAVASASQPPTTVAEPSSTSPPTESSAPARQPGLVPLRLYHGIQRPVLIDVVSPRSFGTVTLALMDESGTLLAAPVPVHPGRIDLAEVLPVIWTIREAAYLQMIDLEQPVGSALVLQPMLSRMVPITAVRPHPVSGQPHTRIVGWADENTLPPPMLPRPQQATAPSTNDGAGHAGDTQTGQESDDSDEAQSQGSDQAQDAPPPIQAPQEEPVQPSGDADRLMTGLRIYVENDVVLHTSMGDIRVALRPDEAPNTAWNFLELARGGFYRDVVFHRVVKFDRQGRPFVIQAGDPSGTGDGGPGYWLPMERSQLPHDFGVISMARADHPDSAGCQFFICLSREGTARLDGQYCAFGYAVSGADAILGIADAPLADIVAGRPANPPVILDAEPVAAPPRIPGRGRPDQRVTPFAAPAKPQPNRVPR